MNIRDFFENKPTFKRTTRYKNEVELKTKPLINELVYNFGEIYLYLGICDGFDDFYYIMVNARGDLSYHSCVGDVGTPLKDLMKEDEYKKFKNSFIKGLKYQRDWKKTWDKRIYLHEPTKYLQVEYFIQDGVPFVKELKTNIKEYYKIHLSKDERKRIRKRFWNYFWHMFGFHHMCERCYEYDELQVVNDENNIKEVNGEYDTVLTGVCDICRRKMIISEGWISNWQFWYKHKIIWFFCKPIVTFLDMYKRAK